MGYERCGNKIMSSRLSRTVNLILPQMLVISRVIAKRAMKTGHALWCGKKQLTLRAAQHILSVNEKSKNPKEKEPAGSWSSQPQPGSCSRSIVSEFLGVFRPRGQSSGPLRNASRPSSGARSRQRDLPAVWGQSTDFLQTPREIPVQGYRRSIAPTTWTKRAIKTDRGSLVLCTATPRSRRVHCRAKVNCEGTNKVRNVSTSKNDREAHKRAPVKKKLISAYTRSSRGQAGITKFKDDFPRTRYESLRRNYLEIPEEGAGDGELFGLFGLSGLLQPSTSRPYILEAHQAHSPRWCGKTDPQEKTLLEVFRQLVHHSNQEVFQN